MYSRSFVDNLPSLVVHGRQEGTLYGPGCAFCDSRDGGERDSPREARRLWGPAERAMGRDRRPFRHADGLARACRTAFSETNRRRDSAGPTTRALRTTTRPLAAGWDARYLFAEQRGMPPRASLAAYAALYLLGRASTRHSTCWSRSTARQRCAETEIGS